MSSRNLGARGPVVRSRKEKASRQPQRQQRRSFFEALEHRNLLATISYEVPAATVGNQTNHPFGLGMDFTVTSPITVTNLGAFDSGSNGISGTINVRLFDRNAPAAPLATAAFTGTGQQLFGGSRFSPIAALNLPAGFQGRIVAEGFGAADPNGNSMGAVPVWTTNSGGALTYTGGGFFGTVAGAYPTNGDTGPVNRYAAGTFAFVPTTLTTLYADDSWSAFTPGQLILDADPGTAGNQNAVFGVDAFATISGAVSAANSATNATVVVREGNYPETVTLNGTKTLEISAPAEAVTVNALNTVAGQALVLEGTATLTIGDATNSSIAGVISGGGSLVKQGAGIVTLSGANTYSGTTSANAGVLEGVIGGTVAAPTNPFGASQITVDGGVVRYNRTAALDAGINRKRVTLTPTTPNTVAIDYDAVGTTHLDTQINGSAGAPSGLGVGHRWTGLLNVTTGGNYLFRTRTDDGSRVYIDGVLVQTSDGGHGVVDKTSPAVSLTPGLHSVVMYYAEGSAGASGGYSFSYSGPDQTTMGLVPAARLFQSLPINLPNNVTVTAAGGGLDVAGNIPGLNLGTLSIGAAGTTNFAATAVSGRRLNFSGTNLQSTGATVNFSTDRFVGLGVVSDAANTGITLVKQGAGQLILDNTSATANDLSGTTLRLTDGRLVNMGSGAAGSTVPLNGAPLIEIAGGTLTLDSKVNSYTFTNPITVTTSGVIEVVPGNSTIQHSTGLTTINGGQALTVRSYGGGANLRGALLQMNGQITGAGDLIKTNVQTNTEDGNTTNTGQLRLTNNGNNYTGSTTVSGGFLIVTVNGALGATSGDTFVQNGAQLRFEGAVTVPAGETISLNGDGPGSIGALRNENNNVTVTDPIVLTGNARTFSNSSTLTLAGGVDVTNGALTVDGGSATNIPGNIVRTANANGITKTGGGTLTLGGTNTYTGTTTINGGIVQIAADANLGAVPGAPTGNIVIGSGVLQGTGTFTAHANRSISLTGGTTPAIRATAGNAMTLAGVISGAAADGITINAGQTGDVIFSGANTYSGWTQINGGRLIAANNAALGAANANTGTVVLTGASLGLQGGITTPAEVLILNGAGVGGAGSLVNIAGNNTFAGAIFLGSAATIGSTAAGDLATLSGDVQAHFPLTVVGNGNVAISGDLSGETGFVAGVMETRYQGGFDVTTAASGGRIVASPTRGYANGAPNWGNNETWLYTGQVFDADGAFVFAENIDDSVRVQINGTSRLQNGTHNVITTSAAVLGATTTNYAVASANAATPSTAFTAGWNGVEIRLGNGTGGAGAVADATNGWATNFGFGFSGSVLASPALYIRSNYIQPTGGLASTDGNLRVAVSNSLTKIGSGTLTLSGNNTYTGETLVDEGQLIAASDNALGSLAGSTTVAFGSTLALDNSVNGNVTIAEDLTVNGDGLGGNGAIRNLAGDNQLTGNILAVATPSPPAMTITAGLELWLDAANVTTSGAFVTSWNDQIFGDNTFANDGTPANNDKRPTWVPSGLNGHPTVQFDGLATALGDRLDLAGTLNLSTNATILFVALDGPQSSATGSCCRPIIADRTSGGGYGDIGYNIAFLRPGAGQPGIRIDKASLSPNDAPDVNIISPIPLGGSSPSNAFHIYAMSSSSSITEFYEDSVLLDSAPLSSTPVATGYDIGGHRDNVLRHYQGQIAEILAFNGTLSAGDRAIVENYLFAKYFTPALPTGDPTITSDVGTLTISGTVSMPDLTINGAGNVTVSGVLQDAPAETGVLTKEGTGTVLLSGTNTYTGTTNVNAGVLQVQNSDAILNSAGAVNVANGAAFQLLSDETISSYVGADNAANETDSILALGGNTLTTIGSATIANVTSANGSLVAGTAIIDGDTDVNVTGTGVFLQAGTSVGTLVNPLETSVANLEGVAGTGFFVASDSNVNIGGVSAANGIVTTGDVVITSTAALTVSENITGTGVGTDIILTTIDAGTAGQDLTVNAGATINTAAGLITLNAGDAATIGGRLASGNTVTVNVDAGDADAGLGGSLTFTGDIDAPLAVFNGNTDVTAPMPGDTFDVRPDQDVGDVLTPIQVFGMAPAANPNGDTLVLDITGLGVPTLTLGPGLRNGAFGFGGLAASVVYNNIETVDTDPDLPYHLVLDMRFSGFENAVADTILAQLNATGMDLILDVNGDNVFTGPDAVIQSLTIIGSSDDDALTIQETAGGLPRFLAAAPAVDNSGIGGGVSAGSHLNASADLVLETLRGMQSPWNGDDVTLHFDGGVGGLDSLTVNQITAASTGYFSDTSDAGNSGNVTAAPGNSPTIGAPTMILSFANLEPLTLNGAGGELLIDATGTPATSSILLTDVGAHTELTADGGVATTRFNGYLGAGIVGGGGAELIDVMSVDTSLFNLLVSGGNTADFFGLAGGETSDDTLRIRSLPANASATLTGNLGDDLFQLFDAANTVDNIAGLVIVNGSDGLLMGTDTLTIVDTGDSTGDSVVIAASGSSGTYFIEGISSNVGTDVRLTNIDVLNYTSTSGDDTIDGRFVNTATQHDLTTINLSGWTGADQFLLFTSDQIGGSGAFEPTGIASGVANINLYGDAPGNPNANDGNDTFGQTPIGVVDTGVMNVGLESPETTRMIRPSVSTSIAIDGGQPTGLAAPLGDVTGDVNNIDVSAFPNTTPVIVSTFSPGAVVANNVPMQPLTWTQIEDLNVVDRGKLTNVQMGDLFARTTQSADLVQITRNPTPTNPNQVRLRITATIGNYSVSNKTIMYGGAMNDTLTQSNLTIPAEFYGEGGDDYLSGAMNNDWLVGGLGNDRINGSGGDNVIWGDNAPTLPSDATPQDSEDGGNDQLSGLGGNDVFYGGGGNDLVSAGAGNDYAYGGEGNDTLDGSDGDDRLYGADGNDVISGHAGNDLLSGGDDDDKLYGSTGNDVLLAGNGADLIDGSSGNDLLVSGSVQNEFSSWTSTPSTATYSPATYSLGTDNDAALLTLLTQWGASSDRSSLVAITPDGDNDDLVGGTGDDDFNWEMADVVDTFPNLQPIDFNAPGQGTDERFLPF